MNRYKTIRVFSISSLFMALIILPALGPHAVYGAPYAYIASSQSGSSSTTVIDTANDTVVQTIPNSAYGLASLNGAAANCGSGAAYTVDASGGVFRIDTSTYAVTRIAVSGIPLALACVPETNRLYAAALDSSGGSDILDVIDTLSNAQTASITLGADIYYPVAIAANATGSQVYVTNESGTIYIVNTATTTVSSISFGAGSVAVGVAVNPDGTRVYVAVSPATGARVLKVIDPIAIPPAVKQTLSLGTGSGPFGIAVSPDGSIGYLTDEGNSALKVLALGSTVSVHKTIGLPSGSQPQGVSVSPDGAQIYICLFVNNQAEHITYNASTGTYTVQAFISVVSAPSCLGNFITPFPAL